MEELTKLLSEWISIPSIYDASTVSTNTPFGINVAKSLNWIQANAKKDGFITSNIDGYYTTIEYGNNENSDDYVGIFGHGDVVPANGTWSSDPFNLTIRDNIFFGRGVVDDKGPIICCYLAMKKIKQSNLKLKRNIRLVIGGNEESGFMCIKHYVKHEKQPTYGFVPDAKFPVLHGERGSTSLKIRGTIKNSNIFVKAGVATNVIPDKLEAHVNNLAPEYIDFLKENNFEYTYTKDSDSLNIHLLGKGGHASKPHLSNNPIPAFISLYKNDWAKTLYKFICKNSKDTFLGSLNKKGKCGELTITPTIININNGNYEIQYDVRYPENVDIHFIEKRLKDYIKTINLDIDYKFSGIKKPSFISADNKLVQTLMSIYQNHTGDYVSKPRITSAGTYASELDNTVIFGMESPFGNSGNVHKENEFIHAKQLLLGIEIYEKAIIKLANM